MQFPYIVEDRWLSTEDYQQLRTDMKREALECSPQTRALWQAVYTCRHQISLAALKTAAARSMNSFRGIEDYLGFGLQRRLQRRQWIASVLEGEKVASDTSLAGILGQWDSVQAYSE